MSTGVGAAAGLLGGVMILLLLNPSAESSVDAGRPRISFLGDSDVDSDRNPGLIGEPGDNELRGKARALFRIADAQMSIGDVDGALESTSHIVDTYDHDYALLRLANAQIGEIAGRNTLALNGPTAEKKIWPKGKADAVSSAHKLIDGIRTEHTRVAFLGKLARTVDQIEGSPPESSENLSAERLIEEAYSLVTAIPDKPDTSFVETLRRYWSVALMSVTTLFGVVIVSLVKSASGEIGKGIASAVLNSTRPTEASKTVHDKA